jgi:hypothetical protein
MCDEPRLANDAVRVHPYQDVDRLARIRDDLDNIGAEEVEPEILVADYEFVNRIDRIRITTDLLSIPERDPAITRRTTEIAALEPQLHALELGARRK